MKYERMVTTILNVKERFTKTVDFIDFKQHIGETDILESLRNFGYANQIITQAKHIYLLSEHSNAGLIKIMDYDFACEIHDWLIDKCFRLREDSNNNQLELQFPQIITPILNNQTKFIQTMMDNK